MVNIGHFCCILMKFVNRTQKNKHKLLASPPWVLLWCCWHIKWIFHGFNLQSFWHAGNWIGRWISQCPPSPRMMKNNTNVSSTLATCTSFLSREILLSNFFPIGVRSLCFLLFFEKDQKRTEPSLNTRRTENSQSTRLVVIKTFLWIILRKNDILRTIIDYLCIVYVLSAIKKAWRELLECSKTIVPRLVGILWIRLRNDILRSIIEYLWMCCLQWRAWREESDCTEKPNWDKPHVIRYLNWDCFPGHLFIHHPLLCIIKNTNIRHSNIFPPHQKRTDNSILCTCIPNTS